MACFFLHMDTLYAGYLGIVNALISAFLQPLVSQT